MRIKELARRKHLIASAEQEDGGLEKHSLPAAPPCNASFNLALKNAEAATTCNSPAETHRLEVGEEDDDYYSEEEAELIDEYEGDEEECIEEECIEEEEECIEEEEDEDEEYEDEEEDEEFWESEWEDEEEGSCNRPIVWESRSYSLEVTVVGAWGFQEEHTATGIHPLWKYYVVAWIDSGLVRRTRLDMGLHVRWGEQIMVFPVDVGDRDGGDETYVFFQLVRKGSLEGDAGRSSKETVVGRARTTMPATWQADTSVTLDLMRPAKGRGVAARMVAEGKLYVRMRFRARLPPFVSPQPITWNIPNPLS